MDNQVFSDAVPQLLARHLEHLQASAISQEIIIERRYRSVLNRRELKDLGFSTAQQRIPGILMPVFPPGLKDPPLYVYRPDEPRESKDGKKVKYETPAHAGIRIDCPPRCHAQLADPSTAVWITEGIKKGDSLATAGVCAVVLLGVNGFRGTNEFGGKTVLADMGNIAWNGRAVYIVFDSDIMTKLPVESALKALAMEAERRGAKEVNLVHLPAGPNGEKVGVDDYFAAGGELTRLVLTAVPWRSGIQRNAEERAEKTGPYLIKDGCLYYYRMMPGDQDPYPTMLADFQAGLVEEQSWDDGVDPKLKYRIKGVTRTGEPLREVLVPAEEFKTMNWVDKYWGSRACLEPGQTVKERLRHAIHSLSRGKIVYRTIFTHTGWRTVKGKRGFLTAAGGLGLENVEVDLQFSSHRRYHLPLQPQYTAEAVAASLHFLDASSHQITIPLWAAMYLGPLCEVLQPSFILWLEGQSQSYKSTLAALALSHFGDFPDRRDLPLNWRSTFNAIEKQLALLKDVPVVIDDLRPVQNDEKENRKLQHAAQEIVRLMGDFQTRQRLTADLTMAQSDRPRGLPIVTGEELLGGYSASGRIFSIHIEKTWTDKNVLSSRQAEQHLYPHAMSAYILWLRDNWDNVLALNEQWRCLRNKFGTTLQGLDRTPEMMAWLQIGLDTGLCFAQEMKVITQSRKEALSAEAQETLMTLAKTNLETTEQERSGPQFLEILKMLVLQGRVTILHRESIDSITPSSLAPFIGWRDEEYFYLDQQATYSAVCEAAKKSGSDFVWRKHSVWQDLKRMGVLLCPDGRVTNPKRCQGIVRSVVWLRRSALDTPPSSEEGAAIL